MSRPAVRDVIIVVCVAFAARLLAALTLPLIITNDGAFYLLWGSEIASGTWPDMPATRTPGYPVFLCGVFTVFGETASAVLAVQHLLGVLCAAMAWLIGVSVAGRRVGLAAGMLIALDPWLLAMSSYALSETLSVTLILAAIASVAGRPRAWSITLAGMCLGAALLVRPATMAWIPGVMLIAASPPAARHRTRFVRLGILCTTVAITIAPWVRFNASRGVSGLAQTDGLALWGGLARAGILDSDYPLPPGVETPPDELFAPNPSERIVLGYFRRLERTDGIDRSELAGEWARASIAAQPLEYAKATGHAMAWQSNAMLPGTPYRHDGLRWTMRRLGGRDAPAEGSSNLSTSHLPKFLVRFEDEPPRGPLSWVLARWPIGMFQSIPQLPLGVLTLAASGVLAWRRRWTAAAVLASSFPIVIGHALLLQPFARYSISAWMIWWIGGAIAVQLAWPYALCLVRYSVPQRSEVDPERRR